MFASEQTVRVGPLYKNIRALLSVGSAIHLYKEPPMSHSPLFCSAWDTSCAGQPADMSLMELSTLGDHLAHCGALRGPLDTFLAGAGLLQALVAEHVVTVAVLLTLVVAAVSLVG